MSLSREEIIQMATEFGWVRNDGFKFYIDELKQFADAVYSAGAAAEREACAKVCEEIGPKGVEFDLITQGFAGAIRARGNGGEK